MNKGKWKPTSTICTKPYHLITEICHLLIDMYDAKLTGNAKKEYIEYMVIGGSCLIEF